MSGTVVDLCDFIVGERRAASTRWLAVAALLFALVFESVALGVNRPVYRYLPGTALVVGAALVFVALAAWQAYRNRGLVVSLALCVAPAYGLFVHVIAEGSTGPHPPSVALTLGGAWALAFGVPLGAVGFALGWGARWLRSGETAVP